MLKAILIAEFGNYRVVQIGKDRLRYVLERKEKDSLGNVSWRLTSYDMGDNPHQQEKDPLVHAARALKYEREQREQDARKLDKHSSSGSVSG